MRLSRAANRNGCPRVFGGHFFLRRHLNGEGTDVEAGAKNCSGRKKRGSQFKIGQKEKEDLTQGGSANNKHPDRDVSSFLPEAIQR